MTLSTHVLDTSTGRPAAGVPVLVERFDGDSWRKVGNALTGPDGRAADLVAEPDWAVGRYRLVFDVGTHASAFFPRVTIDIAVAETTHHHVPLLLAPFGYTTYRGS